MVYLKRFGGRAACGLVLCTWATLGLAQSPARPAVKEMVLPPIGSLTTDISTPASKGTIDRPPRSSGSGADVPPDGPPCEPIVFYWHPPVLCHKPTYFEDANLERYGYSHWGPLQSAASGADFYLRAVTLPYAMLLQPPCEPVYTLGYYRLGSGVPYRDSCPLLNPEGGVFEAAVAGSLCFLP